MSCASKWDVLETPSPTSEVSAKELSLNPGNTFILFYFLKILFI